jgi:hypothetical protein
MGVREGAVLVGGHLQTVQGTRTVTCVSSRPAGRVSAGYALRAWVIVALAVKGRRPKWKAVTRRAS